MHNPFSESLILTGVAPVVLADFARKFAKIRIFVNSPLFPCFSLFSLVVGRVVSGLMFLRRIFPEHIPNKRRAKLTRTEAEHFPISLHASISAKCGNAWQALPLLNCYATKWTSIGLNFENKCAKVS